MNVRVVKYLVNQLVIQSVTGNNVFRHRSVSQSVSQSISQSVNQSVSQTANLTSSYIPIDYNLFQFIYESFLDWIPTQTDKLNILSRVSNIWITTDVIILEMLLSYFRDVFQIEHAFMYLPSLDLYDQILFQYVSTSRDQFAFWLQNYNNRFIFKVEEMVYFQILLEELIQNFEDSDNKINNEKKKPQKKKKIV